MEGGFAYIQAARTAPNAKFKHKKAVETALNLISYDQALWDQQRQDASLSLFGACEACAQPPCKL
jgi:hypothetical protein